MFKRIGCYPVRCIVFCLLQLCCGSLFAFQTKKTDPAIRTIDSLIALAPGQIRSDIAKAQKTIATINRLSLAANYKHGVLESLFDQCWLLYHTGSIDRCIISVDSIIEHTPGIYGDPGAMKFNILKGQCYVKKTQFSLAIKEFSVALKLAEKNKDEGGKAGTVLSIGWAYMENKKFHEAIDFFTEILKIKAPNQYLDKATVLNNIASCYNSLAKYKEAANYARQAVTDSRADNNLIDLANGLNILAGAIDQQGDTKQALAYLNEASKVRAKVGDPAMLASDYLELSDMYRKNGQFAQAVAYAQKGVNISKKNNINLKLQAGYEALAGSLEAAGNYKQADSYYKKLIAYKDTANTAANNEAMADLLVKYNTQKKITENLQLKHDNLNARLTLANKQRWLTLSVALAILIIIISIFSYINTRNRYQTRLALQQITEQKNRTLAVLETEENERRRIAADLHDGVSQMLAAVSIQLKKHDRSIEIAHDLLEQAAAEVRAVSHQMTSELLKHYGLVKAIENNLAQLNSPGSPAQFHFFNMVENGNVDELLQVMLYRSFQELVNNINKHAQATEVNIHLTINEETTLLMIEDDGIGFDTKNDHNGLGLRSLASRIKVFNGDLMIDSIPGNGTTVIVKFDTPSLT
ncbi:MAG TPA: ATP-binding protein [Mucilaginibacter sp.]|nr:ATP-binding protein [Mucilaginibacter sp.]